MTSFFLTTVVRARDRKSIPNYILLITPALESSVMLSCWIIETFSSQDLIKELLIDCPIPDMKRFVAGLIKTAIDTIYKHEEKYLREYISKACVSDLNMMEFLKELVGELGVSVTQ